MNVKTLQTGSFWSANQTLSQALAGPGNLFTPLRMLLALGVLLGHSYVVNLGRGVPEPLSLFNMTISYVAVNGFFILSGLLITRSIDRNPDFIRFFAARFLRIYPAMALMALLAAFVFGPVVTSLPLGAYFTDPQVWRYVCDVLTFGDTAGGPPQIFDSNPFDGEWSASLWTLRYEAIAYAGTAVVAVLGISRSKTAMLALFVSSVSLFVVVRMGLVEVPNPLIHLSRFAVTYLLGAVLYIYRDQVRLSWPVGLLICLAAWVFGPTPAFEIMLNFVLAAGLLLIGFAKIPGRQYLFRMPDFSYGVYIWQWPVMQALWYYDLVRDPMTTMIVAIPLSVLMGAISWYLVEKPMLALKGPFAAWLRLRLKVGKTA
ncbi:hypothetical protein MNBD_ALPHA06-528 [hydrothermal vent metagenome]|uniref:Acyltransferase 3 domain-containing protein n=1 Tax=hydrothermal vent metagenome TaxID=652676 RepID=A0A3B0S9S8_9ZZZZ